MVVEGMKTLVGYAVLSGIFRDRSVLSAKPPGVTGACAETTMRGSFLRTVGACRGATSAAARGLA
jgi:hypothetical protein